MLKMLNSNINNYQYFNRSNLNFLQKWWIDIDKINFFFAIFIILFGLMMTISSSPAIAERIDADKFLFIKKQLVFSFLAILILVFISFLNKKNLMLLMFAGSFFTFCLMVFLLFFGNEVKGSKRWISLLGISIQPSEFAKTFFVTINAYLLYIFANKNFFVKYGASLSLFIVAAGLLILQPDFGMTIVFALLWSAQLFLNGISLLFVIILGLLAIIGGFLAYSKLPHVEDRINRFLDINAKNYQAEMSLDAYGNGSYFGVGPGAGVVKNHIPDAHTDFIFSVIAEEFGIISCVAIIILIAYIFSRIVRRALREDDIFNYLVLSGLAIQFVLQVIINIGVTLRLLPTKGMTLPFISYGGSSTLSMAICFGIILALTKKRYHDHVDYGNTKLI